MNMFQKLMTSLEKDNQPEDHEVADQNIYRFYYIEYIDKPVSIFFDNKSCSFGIFRPFISPAGMSREDVFKVLSFLVDYIDAYSRDDRYQNVSQLDTILDLDALGFERFQGDAEQEPITNLFIIAGHAERFKKHPLFSEYFTWYVPGVTKEEVESIYLNCGLKFADLETKRNSTYVAANYHSKSKQSLSTTILASQDSIVLKRRLK